MSLHWFVILFIAGCFFFSSSLWGFLPMEVGFPAPSDLLIPFIKQSVHTQPTRKSNK
jgi:hypothetical protein